MYKSSIKNVSKHNLVAKNGNKKCLKTYGMAETYVRWKKTVN